MFVQYRAAVKGRSSKGRGQTSVSVTAAVSSSLRQNGNENIHLPKLNINEVEVIEVYWPYKLISSKHESDQVGCWSYLLVSPVASCLTLCPRLCDPGQPAGSLQGFRRQLQGGARDGREVQPSQRSVPEDIRGTFVLHMLLACNHYIHYIIESLIITQWGQNLPIQTLYNVSLFQA